MLLAEDPLDLLLDRLRELPPADRRAVLHRLSTSERRRIEAALDAPSAVAAPRFAADIAARIAAPHDGSLTAATREVLLRVAGAPAPSEVSRPSPSLFGRLGDAMRRR